MKPFCHHINFYFTIEEEGWPPCGEKIKDGVSKQMEVWKGNRGLQIMVTMGWDGMGWDGHQDWQWGRKDPEVEVLRGEGFPPFPLRNFCSLFGWPKSAKDPLTLSGIFPGCVF